MKWLACLAFFCCAATGALAAVDANTATRAELESVRGIGPSTSQRIVDERRRQPFRDTEDLARRVKGIGAAKLRKMTEAGLTVGGNGVVVTMGGMRSPALPERAVAGANPDRRAAKPAAQWPK